MSQKQITKDLEKKTKPELEKLLKEEKENLRKMYFSIAENKLKDVRKIRKTKKTIARILTFLKNQ